MAKTLLEVLLVEDDADHAEMVRANLARAELTSFELTRVECLAAANENLGQATYDAVLLDLGLPDALGLEGLSEIRRRCPNSAVVVLTSNSSPSVGIETASAGADDYVFKGDMNPRTLERVLHHAVQRRAVLLQLREANESLDRTNAELQQMNRLLDERNEQLQTAKDLLDRKNKRLAQLYEMGQQFIDNVSHDFRTPLTVIKEYVSIVRDGLAGQVTEQQRRYLGIVNDRTDDLTIMVDDMLDMSRLDAGLMSVWRRDSRIGDVFEHVRPTLDRKATVKNVMLTTEVEEDLPVVYCDPDKIGRVIVNLAVNAIKFCDSGGTVTLWAKRSSEASEVTVGVTDDGPGISPESLQRIFERFQQAGGSPRVRADGFGLGLSIAKELVDLNLGVLNVHSEPGEGSTFSFSLPTSSPEELVGRYLRQMKRADDDNGNATLLVVTIESPVERAVSNGVDEFLQHTFRGGDLVLRILSHKWLVLTQCPRQEISKMLHRVEAAWSEGNRNMPAAKLPRIEVSVKGTWTGAGRAEEILRQCRSELAQAVDEPEGSRILLVDDDEQFVQGLEIRLRAAGYEVVTARDGREAVDIALEKRPDAILLDNYMPVMGGLETIEELSKHHETMEVPVIVLSASSRDQRKALKLGACFFLQKPCEVNVLTAALREVIAEPLRAGLE